MRKRRRLRRRPLVAFLLSVPNDACRSVGGPQALTGQMRWFRSRSGRVPPTPYVGPERRRTPRYYVQLPIESSHGIGTTIDVGEDGVRFESTHRFVYGEVLTLRLVFRGDHTHIDVTGDVVRVEESGETFRVAVRVDEIHVN